MGSHRSLLCIQFFEREPQIAVRVELLEQVVERVRRLLMLLLALRLEALVVQLDGGEGETRVLADRLARLAMGGEVGDRLRRAKTWGGEGVA